jgi:hypothetical protein
MTVYAIGAAVSLPLNQRDIRSFGAKVDARYLTGLNASGSTITASTSLFQASDVGKTIAIFGPAGVTTKRTVATYISATQVTTTTSAGAITGPARGIVGTDDTAAWQAAIDWAAGRITGGVILASGEGVSLVAGPQVSGTVTATNPNAPGATYPYSGQLVIPAYSLSAGPGMRTVQILGDVTPASASLPGTDVEPYSTGFQIFSTVTDADDGFMIDAISHPFGTLYSPTPVTMVMFLAKRLTFRKRAEQAAAGGGGGLNLYACISAFVEDISIDVLENGAIGTGSVSSGATSRKGTALVLPADQNASLATARNVNIWGYAKGIEHGEHAIIDGGNIQDCGAGLAPGRIASGGGLGVHGTEYRMPYVGRCTTVIEPVGTGNRTVQGTIQVEVGTWLIDDPSNTLRGDIALSGNVSTTGWMQIRGALNPELNVRYGDRGGRLDPSSANRIIDSLSGAGRSAFGAGDGTGHIWKPANMAVDPNGAYFTAGVGYAFAVNRQPPASRLVSATIKTSPTTSRTYAGLVLRSPSNLQTPLYLILAKTAALGGLYLYKNDGGGETLLGSSTAVVPSANTSYTVAVAIETTMKPGAGVAITVYLNGTSRITYSLSAPELALGLWTPSGVDGLYGYVGADGDDGGSRITTFSAVPLA